MNISEGVSLFNDKKYFECHDYFEDLWMQCSNRDRLFYQGMVQAAVGCYHYNQNHYNSAINQFRKSIDKLKLYPDVFLGVGLANLISELSIMKYELEIIANGKSREIKKIDCPKIEYSNF